MNNVISTISKAKEKALKGERLTRKMMLELLSISEDSVEFYELGKAAREITSEITNNRAYLWGAIGLDYKPCIMNCEFCSMGEKWGLVTNKNEYVMRVDEILERVNDYVACGIRWIVLRTTQFYPLNELVKIVTVIKSNVKGNYELGLNIGEFDENFANKLYDAGLDFVYHSLRLREGKQTKFNPQQRVSTLSAIKNSKLNLVHLIEPIGIEHSNEEIVEIYESVLDHSATVSGAMARVPVLGTPLGCFPQISDKRLAHIIAFTRLSSAGIVKDICVHPTSELAMSFGANVAVIESGAIPRTDKYIEDSWQGITCKDVREMFENKGYSTYEKQL